MKELEPQTRKLFDALRTDGEVSAATVDAAWASFRTADRDPVDRHRTAAYVAVGAAAAAVVLWAAATFLPPRSTTAAVESNDYGLAISNGQADRASGSTQDTQRAGQTTPEPSVPHDDVERVVDPKTEPPPPPVAEPMHESAATPRPRGASTARSTLAAEVRLLDAAESALHDDHLERAKTLLRDHRRRFPHGLLAAERRILEKRLRSREKSRR